jgi:hypothetical protein
MLLFSDLSRAAIPGWRRFDFTSKKNPEPSFFTGSGDNGQNQIKN